ncbi:NADH dehydrogenase subunit 5 [Capsicum annuum]|nr:NADH dehydrogenase subunit 5 [Capsicum annuum]KAF3655562.1 NADH dehydrogenase subunit 5 [Capsicum annuum]
MMSLIRGKVMMSIYLSRLFPRSNSSFFLCRGNALQSKVLRLREEMFLVDAGLGTPRICMQDEPIGVPINRATRFKNRVGFLDLVAGESLIKEQILERFFIDLVAGESLIKERVAARFNDLVGSTDVVAERGNIACHKSEARVGTLLREGRLASWAFRDETAISRHITTYRQHRRDLGKQPDRVSEDP